MDIDSFKLLLSILIIAIGWIVVHRFNSSRDSENRKKELRIEFLISAYRRLESSANRYPQPEDQAREFESAIADIQLLGSPKLVNETIEFLKSHASGDDAKIDDLLDIIRQELRQEVGLKGKIPPVQVFRFRR